MKIVTIFSSALMLALAGTAGAQVSKTLTGEMKTVTVSVEPGFDESVIVS